MTQSMGNERAASTITSDGVGCSVKVYFIICFMASEEFGLLVWRRFRRVRRDVLLHVEERAVAAGVDVEPVAPTEIPLKRERLAFPDRAAVLADERVLRRRTVARPHFRFNDLGCVSHGIVPFPLSRQHLRFQGRSCSRNRLR